MPPGESTENCCDPAVRRAGRCRSLRHWFGGDATVGASRLVARIMGTLHRGACAYRIRFTCPSPDLVLRDRFGIGFVCGNKATLRPRVRLIGSLEFWVASVPKAG